MMNRHSILSSSGYEYDTDEDDAISQIRRSSATELVELWKGEYQATSRELSKIRNEFRDLRGRYSAKSNECNNKDQEIAILRKTVNDLDHKLAKEKNQTDYWFRKSEDLENKSAEQKRKSTETLKIQHSLDEAIANKYKDSTNKLEKKINDLENYNTNLSSTNARLESMLKSLLQNDEEYYYDAVRKSKAESTKSKRKYRKSSSSHFECDTQSSLSKQRDPIYKTHKLLVKKSEELRKLLGEIESEVRETNMRNFEHGNRILDKTKEARRQQRILDACL